MRWYGSLRRAAHIAQVRRRGRRISFPTLSAYGLAAHGGASEIGITVSKALGSAVCRNLVRRRIRGALDELGPAQPAPARLLLVARPPAAQVPYRQLAADVAAAVAQLARR